MKENKIENIEELLCEFSCYILGRYRNGSKKPSIGKKMLSYLSTTFIYIGFLIFFTGISLLEGLHWISEGIRALLNILYSKNTKQIGTQNTELAYQIREILCTILRKNAKVLGILAPDTVADITPIQYNVYSSINGLDYLRFIAPYVEDVSDLTSKRDFLNQKITQYAQENLYSLPIFYNDLCIFTVFEIEKDLHHSNCLCIKIAIIDSPEKYNYILQHLTSKPTVSTKQVTDLEF